MAALSLDLRERITAAVERGGSSQATIAEQFSVSLSFVEKLMKRVRSTGSCAVLPWDGGRRRALSNDRDIIEAKVKEQPDISLAELCTHVEQAGGAKSSLSMMCRELQLMELPRKKSQSTRANRIPRA